VIINLSSSSLGSASTATPQIASSQDQMTTEPVEEQEDNERIFIADVAKVLGRYEHTVRRWVRESEKIFGMAGFVPDDQGLMPQDLWPEREGAGRKRIWWKTDQIDALKEFAAMKASRKGWSGGRSSS
jgi:hypothetical protein